MGFYKVVAMPSNIAEMYVEELTAGAEVMDHVENLGARVGKRL